MNKNDDQSLGFSVERMLRGEESGKAGRALEDWDRARAGQPLVPIAPLE